MLFAHLKRILKLDRLRLRGPNGARYEFLLAATAQNLRKLAKLIPIPNLKPAGDRISLAIYRNVTVTAAFSPISSRTSSTESVTSGGLDAGRPRPLCPQSRLSECG
jgi:hypothetical protein